MRPQPRLLLDLALGTLLVALAGCECDRASDRSTGSGGEGADETAPGAAADDEGADDDGEHAAAARPTGPIGRLVAPFDDEAVETRLVVLRRTGAAEGEARDDATVLGAGWLGGREAQLTVLEERAAEGRTATLFGPVGACEARVLREVVLRDDAAEPSRYEGVEVAPCQGVSVETLETTYPFGVEGPARVEELSSRTMEAPSEEVAAAVTEAERAAGDGEEMDLLARPIGETGVTVVSGWTTHVVRGGALLESFEDGIPAYVTVGDRTLLVARVGRETRLYALGEGGLERLALETDLANAE
jgi:hypothetical protein